MLSSKILRTICFDLEPDGTLAHTNHYVCDSMLSYEGDTEYAESEEEINVQ